MTQKELILKYIAEHGSILPAKIGGHIYHGVMFGSETSKRCRELRKKGVLTSKKDGKFERFYEATQPIQRSNPRVIQGSQPRLFPVRAQSL